MEDRLIEQVRDVRVMEGVHDAPAAPLADYKTEVAKHAQLVRHRGALHPNGQGELVHGASSLSEPRENANPARRRKRLHRFRHLLRGLRIDDCRPTVPLNSVTHAATLAARMLRSS